MFNVASGAMFYAHRPVHWDLTRAEKKQKKENGLSL
jgi:hypothetical protein